ncbi:MAG TPA: hypothetical protein VNR70_03745 [Steroidobacteraceae bacterium]|nr:hypothetical protein [Steroidobacteraceae bacterium]
MNTPMAWVSLRRCSNLARSSVGGAGGWFDAVVRTSDGRGWAAAAPACLAGRVVVGDFAFAGLESGSGLTGGRVAASARCSVPAAELGVDRSTPGAG